MTGFCRRDAMPIIQGKAINKTQKQLVPIHSCKSNQGIKLFLEKVRKVVHRYLFKSGANSILDIFYF
jgi:hypothetical protein